MLDSIRLNFGPSGPSDSLEIPLSNITVFVGPNNSGKSLALSEIYKYCTAGPTYGYMIIDKVVPKVYSKEEIEESVKFLETSRRPTEDPDNDEVILGKIDHSGNSINTKHVRMDRLLNSIAPDSSDSKYFFEQFLSLHTLKLGGPNRVGLVNPTHAGDLQSPARNYLSLLFRDDERREQVRRIVYDAFGKYLVIDPTNLGTFRVALSEEKPPNRSIEQGLHNEAITFHKKAIDILEFSDGVKAFTGIIIAIVAGSPEIILIDEPEAFLHPALSYKLGREIGASMRGDDKRIFVATHSASFLMGCSNSGATVNVVRLTYTNGIPTARLLGEERLLQLMRNPLLRSTKVLEALFYEFVIVVEGDTDRAFYQEINDRLTHSEDDRGIPNCLFINAQNKQTVFDIVNPLRELGIPAAAVVDMDVLKDGGKVWTKVLNSINVPPPNHTAYHSMRQEAKRAFGSESLDMKRGGLNLLHGADGAAVSDVLDHLAEYGVFVVPGGQLEEWMKDLGCEGHGPNWLMCVFEKLGENPYSEDYIEPAQGDVWDFVARIKGWLENPRRKGIPS